MRKSTKLVLLGIILGLVVPFFSNGMLSAEKGYDKKNPEKQVEKLAKKVGLTPEQQEQLKKLIDEKNQKIEEAVKNYDEQFKNLLNDDQKKKWDEIEKEKKEKREKNKKEKEKKSEKVKE